jgi:hypothetical protein
LRKTAAGGRSQHPDLHGPIFRGNPGAVHSTWTATGAASAIGDVHRDFHAKAEINRLRSYPFHDESSFDVSAAPTMFRNTGGGGNGIIMNVAS